MGTNCAHVCPDMFRSDVTHLLYGFLYVFIIIIIIPLHYQHIQLCVRLSFSFLYCFSFFWIFILDYILIPSLALLWTVKHYRHVHMQYRKSIYILCTSYGIPAVRRSNTDSNYPNHLCVLGGFDQNLDSRSLLFYHRWG